MWSTGPQSGTPASSLWTSSLAPRFSGNEGAALVAAELSLDVLRRKCLRRPPWSLSEEITFVHQHAVMGNAWARLAAHLPQRDSSEVKNIFYSTTRSKGDNNRRVLSAYARAVQGREEQPASRAAALAAAVAEMPACVAAAQAARVEGWEEAARAAEEAVRQLRLLQQPSTAASPGLRQQAPEAEQAAVAATNAQAAPGRAVSAQPSMREGSSSRQSQLSPQPPALQPTAVVQAPAVSTVRQEQAQARPLPAALVPDASPARGLAAAGRLGRDNNSHTASTAASGLGEPAYDEGPSSNDSSANNLSLNGAHGSLCAPTTMLRQVDGGSADFGCTRGGSMGSQEVTVTVRSSNAESAADSAEHGLLLLLAAAAEGAAGSTVDIARATAGLGGARRASEAAAPGPSSTSRGGGSGSAGRFARRLQEVEEEVFGSVGPADLALGRAAAAAEGRREREWDELAAMKRRRVASSDGAGVAAYAAASAGSGVDGNSGHGSDATTSEVSAIAARLRQLTAGDGVAAARLLLQQLLQQQSSEPAAARIGGSYDGRCGVDWRPALSGCSVARTEQQEALVAPAGPLLTLRWVQRTAEVDGSGSDGFAASGLYVGGGRGGLVAAAGSAQPPAVPAAVTAACDPHRRQAPQRQDAQSLYAAQRQQVTQAAAAAAAAAVLARYGRGSTPAYSCKQ